MPTNLEKISILFLDTIVSIVAMHKKSRPLPGGGKNRNLVVNREFYRKFL